MVYRGKHCPVSKNYLASLQQIYYELDELGVEVIAVSGDGRERAEAFVSAPQQPPVCMLLSDDACSHATTAQRSRFPWPSAASAYPPLLQACNSRYATSLSQRG